MLQIHGQNIIACVWDFDKTLIPGYMQSPLLSIIQLMKENFGKRLINCQKLYSKRGLTVSSDTIYLNHLLSYVKNGPMRGLTNQNFMELGAEYQISALDYPLYSRN